MLGAVLPPAAGERLGAAFDKLAPNWGLKSAAVGENHVLASLCDKQQCYDVQFEEPQADCAGLSLAAWCIGFDDTSPNSLRIAIEAEFGSHRPADFWLVPEADAGGHGIAEEPPPSAIFPVLLALSLLLLPIPLGWALGVGLRRFKERRVAASWGGALMLLVPLLPAFFIPLNYLPVGFYDLLAIGLLIGIGLVAGGHRWGRTIVLREALLVAGALMVALVIVEVVVRLALPAPAAFPPPTEASFRLVATGANGVGGQACKGLFPERFPELVQERSGVVGRTGQVLHVGDSMVEGVGVEPGERFVSRLNQLDARAAHINVGFAGTGPEYYYLATRRWQTLSKSGAVVWYLYLFNDIDGGLQEPYGCCGGSTLLAYGEDQFEERCPAWKVGAPDNRFQNSPAPYPLRVATAYFRTAGHLVQLHNRLVQVSPRGAVPLAESLRRTGLVLRKAVRELGEQGVGFTVVLLPYRGVLEGESVEQQRISPMRSGVLEICEQHGIRCLDGTAPFARLVESGDVESAFINEPVWDYHFSAEGHRIVAEWLVEVLGLGGA